MHRKLEASVVWHLGHCWAELLAFLLWVEELRVERQKGIVLDIVDRVPPGVEEEKGLGGG